MVAFLIQSQKILDNNALGNAPEDLANDLFQHDGYNFHRSHLPGTNGNQGFDGVFIKRDASSNIEDIIINESKQAKTNKCMLPDLLFFKGFLKNDQLMMVEGIKELVKPRLHKKHNDFFIVQKKYLSFPAILYAKLAWLKGFEVEIESPLVPRELLPHRPNAHYDDSYSNSTIASLFAAQEAQKEKGLSAKLRGWFSQN
jgi:hypothetical protein